MTIGPEPMIRIFLMSLRFGICLVWSPSVFFHVLQLLPICIEIQRSFEFSFFATSKTSSSVRNPGIVKMARYLPSAKEAEKLPSEAALISTTSPLSKNPNWNTSILAPETRDPCGSKRSPLNSRNFSSQRFFSEIANILWVACGWSEPTVRFIENELVSPPALIVTSRNNAARNLSKAPAKTRYFPGGSCGSSATPSSLVEREKRGTPVVAKRSSSTFFCGSPLSNAVIRILSEDGRKYVPLPTVHSPAAAEPKNRHAAAIETDLIYANSPAGRIPSSCR